MNSAHSVPTIELGHGDFDCEFTVPSSDFHDHVSAVDPRLSSVSSGLSS